MDFLTKVEKQYCEEDFLAIKYAHDYASRIHAGQKRASGDDYITHPVASAEILMELGLDSDSIIAALLHDAIEDTDDDAKNIAEEIRSKFGAGICEMVLGVTKLTKLDVSPRDTPTDVKIEQAETIRNLFFAMAKDIRVLLVKLADRLHNMRTLQYLDDAKRLRKSRETLDIYAPLAGRLGISSIKCELEDLSMKYLYPAEHAELQAKLDTQLINRNQLVNRLIDKLTIELDKIKMTCEIKGRPKHFYSIFKKMRDQGKTLDEIYDLVAIRVIVGTISDCYSVLGIIHSMWKPIPGRFKDYISSPKANMYQSLHTTIVSDFGQIFEIQIRTFDMNRIAEYGIAAHWKYKEGVSAGEMSAMDSKLGWLKEFMDVQSEYKDSSEFLKLVRMNVNENTIYVFTPKGTVINLPEGSTGIDFAYRIHSEIGNRCQGIKINNIIKPLDTRLETGQVIEVLTSNSVKGPSRDWLNYAKTPAARSKIRAFFKKAMKDENIKLGRDELESETKRKGLALSDLMLDASVKLILDKYNLSDVNDMYASIGSGELKAKQILSKLFEFYKKSVQLPADETSILAKSGISRSYSGIDIEGFGDFLITVAHCCNPLPGDDIVGYVTKGRGVVVHRVDCPNIKLVKQERLLDASWNADESALFNAPLHIETELNPKILMHITAEVAKANYKVTALNAIRSKAKDMMIIKINLEIRSARDLNSVMRKISHVRGVRTVARENST